MSSRCPVYIDDLNRFTPSAFRSLANFMSSSNSVSSNSCHLEIFRPAYWIHFSVLLRRDREPMHGVSHVVRSSAADAVLE